MMKWMKLSGLLCVLLMAAGCATSMAPSTGPFTFCAVGDGPRSDGDWPLLREQVAVENAEGVSRFFVHLGDIWHGSEELPASHYAAVAGLLQTSTIPVYIVPGDNEWNDLKDPDVGWANWTQYLLGIDRNMDGPPVARQPSQQANLAFVQDGILFIGLNIVGGRVHDEAEWKKRHADSAQWVKEQIAGHGDDVRALVVFAQAAPKERHEDFFGPFVSYVEAFGKPAMYLHGDGHKYQVEPGWRVPNLTRVQTDQVSKAPPLRITITNDPAAPWAFDRQLDNADYKGPYTERTAATP